MIRTIISDDHAMFREGVKRLFETEKDICIEAEAGTGAETLRLCRELKPDVILLDLDLPEMDGIEITRRIRDEGLDIKIIILTMHTNEEYAVRMLRLGAAAYIPKYVSGQILPVAIRTVMSGKRFLPEEMREIVMRRLLESPRTEAESLTDRELQIFKMYAEGKSTNEIAEALGISPRTIETHKSRIMEKMGLKNIADLVRTAIRLGIA